MESNLAQERQRAHAYLDRLPENQLAAVRGLLESILSPLDRRLALAPLDDESLTPAEAAAIQAGAASLDRNGGVPMETILSDFGIGIDELRAMPDPPLRETSNRNA